MNSPLQLSISKDNVHSAIIQFLYSISAIPEKLDVTSLEIRNGKSQDKYELTIHFREESEDVEIKYF